MAKHLAPETEGTAKPPLLRKIATIVGIVLVGCLAVIAGFSIAERKNPIQLVASQFVPTPQHVFGKNNLLVLVVGLDYDYNDKDEEYSSQSRSDVIKVVNLDFVNKRAFVLSVPRDMIATLPDGHQAKINEAMSDGGITEAKSVIAQWLGIPPFDKYVILRINALKELINAIGGVEVNVKDSDCLWNHECKNQTRLDYDDTWGHLHIHLNPGLQHLSGDNAVGYARFRHDWCSDPCRIMRQAQVLDAVVAKLKSDKVNTLLHAGQLIGVVQRNVSTDLTATEMLALANYFIDVKKKDIVQKQVPGVGDQTLADGGDATIPDVSARARMVRTMLIAPPTPEPSPDAMALASIVPGTLHVDVENASGVSGAAARVAGALRKQGFVIANVGNAATSSAATTSIEEHSKTLFAGAKVRAALPQALQSVPIVPDDDPAAPQTSSDVTILVGKDLATVVTALASPGPASNIR